MGSEGNPFRDALVRYIESWGVGLQCTTEKTIGLRFVRSGRTLDIIVRNPDNNKVVGIEAKVQLTEGTAYEKLSYALDDCLTAPIPTVLAFAGSKIKPDMQSKLILSGVGIELGLKLDHTKDTPVVLDVVDPGEVFKQRIFMELDLNWYEFLVNKGFRDDDYGDVYNKNLQERFDLYEKIRKAKENIGKIKNKEKAQDRLAELESRYNQIKELVESE